MSGLGACIGSFTAGFILRPDNTEVLSLLLLNGAKMPPISVRIKWHAYANYFAVAICLANVIFNLHKHIMQI